MEYLTVFARESAQDGRDPDSGDSVMSLAGEFCYGFAYWRYYLPPHLGNPAIDLSGAVRYPCEPDAIEEAAEAAGVIPYYDVPATYPAGRLEFGGVFMIETGSMKVQLRKPDVGIAFTLSTYLKGYKILNENYPYDATEFAQQDVFEGNSTDTYLVETEDAGNRPNSLDLAGTFGTRDENTPDEWSTYRVGTMLMVEIDEAESPVPA